VVDILVVLEGQRHESRELGEVDRDIEVESRVDHLDVVVEEGQRGIGNFDDIGKFSTFLDNVED